ncbi:sulfotransferase family protein [Actinacidiphila sp. ITFR-21]|uniref:sulfotransferase-like domain-containing protein n=1 Tax=Actinacidiphila sp. ITFR-21 TaxID=3075199 RepID=UPI002889A7D9|nr:sulfotransferase family protein [Streptomyces sp. ITFR-21]WNI18014.1 sulfotransferase family protein [Streptomyces sp. ITFR-21]
MNASTLPPVLALWSPPRSMSTAFFRMMAQRGDFRMHHEPFSDLAARQPYVVDGTPLTTPEQVFWTFVESSAGTPVFFKDTTEYPHVRLFDELPFVERVTHTFIIREPRRAIESHYAMNPGVTLAEVGFEHLYQIFERVRTETGRAPAVIDADVLIERPVETVRAYCDTVGIAFDEGALSWSPGERSEWSRTSHWHKDVADSSGFRQSSRQYEVTVDNNAKLAGYYRHHLPFYEQLRAGALAVPAAG